MKSKINKLVERNLCCNNAESLKNKEKILLKKQLVKASESEKSKEQKYWTQISMRFVFLCNYFQLQYYSWKDVIEWCLLRTFCFSSMKTQILKKKWNEWKQVKKVFTNTVYKKKTDKIKSLDLNDYTSKKFEENIEWWNMF